MEQETIKGLIAFIKEYTTLTQIYQGWQNRVAQPKNDYCFITMTSATRKMTNIKELNRIDDTIDIIELLDATFQIDFWGLNSYSNAVKIKTLLRDGIGCDFLAPYNFSPLFCSQLRNLTKETVQQDQYKKRYGFDLSVNFYENVVVSSDFFNEAILTTSKEVQSDGSFSG